jgi:hypothetical protein
MPKNQNAAIFFTFSHPVLHKAQINLVMNFLSLNGGLTKMLAHTLAGPLCYTMSDCSMKPFYWKNLLKRPQYHINWVIDYWWFLMFQKHLVCFLLLQTNPH